MRLFELIQKLAKLGEELGDVEVWVGYEGRATQDLTVVKYFGSIMIEAD